MVQIGYLIPSTTFDSRNTNNRVPYLTKPDCAALWRLGLSEYKYCRDCNDVGQSFVEEKTFLSVSVQTRIIKIISFQSLVFLLSFLPVVCLCGRFDKCLSQILWSHGLGITQSWNPLAALSVWLPADSDTAPGGKPHYSWASIGGGEFPFLTSFSMCRSLFTVRLFTVRRENGVGVERPHLPADLFTSSQFTRC